MEKDSSSIDGHHLQGNTLGKVEEVDNDRGVNMNNSTESSFRKQLLQRMLKQNILRRIDAPFMLTDNKAPSPIA